jgi:predicted Zn-dependent protease
LDEARSAETPELGVEATAPAHWKVRRHWRRLGRAMQEGHLGRAERLAIRHLRKHPQDSTSWQVWGEVLRAREQHADEERILRRGLDFTGAPRLRFRLAQILASRGHLEEAMSILEAFSTERLRSLLPGSAQLETVSIER